MTRTCTSDPPSGASCSNHDPIKAGGQDKRCTERRIRADELDTFVFEQVRELLLRPDVRLAGENAVVGRQPAPDDELLAAQLARLERRIDEAAAERRRVTDLYQAGHVKPLPWGYVPIPFKRLGFPDWLAHTRVIEAPQLSIADARRAKTRQTRSTPRLPSPPAEPEITDDR